MGTGAGKEKSTVGSASATGSAAGERGGTWASGAWDGSEGDKMSVSEEDTYRANALDEDADERMADDIDNDNDGVSSSAGLSDEGNASLVGFGEGAGSTVSADGRVSTPTGGRGKGGVGGRGQVYAGGSGSGSGRGFNGGGMTGTETAERIVRERRGRGVGGVEVAGGGEK